MPPLPSEQPEPEQPGEVPAVAPQGGNPLRAARDGARITRLQLSLRCGTLARNDPTSYTTISINAIRDLEVGRTKPRRGTPVTLAAALHSEVETLFPDGIDTPLRNPEGRTYISPDRPKGGRPRKPKK